MLVLTRKTNEEILIGDNIKITLVRVRGNSVRIGIEAPREVRVVRGELQTHASNASDLEIEAEVCNGEEVFAHPQPKVVAGRRAMTARRLMNESEETGHRVLGAPALKPQIFVGRVRCSDDPGKFDRAPLAEFVAAS